MVVGSDITDTVRPERSRRDGAPSGVVAVSAEGWATRLTELKNRGVKDILIACVDGLKGFPEAIEAVYPRIEVQLCIVHLVLGVSSVCPLFDPAR